MCESENNRANSTAKSVHSTSRDSCRFRLSNNNEHNSQPTDFSGYINPQDLINRTDGLSRQRERARATPCIGHCRVLYRQ